MTESPPLEVKSLTKEYRGQVALKDIDLEVPHGSVKTILGPSGSGKSTLLRLISLLEPATSGEILLSGKQIGVREKHGKTVPAEERTLAKQRTDIGMVFQHFNLFPHLNVLENITLGPLVVAKRKKNESVERAEELLNRVGLADRKHAFPSELSGGQQQRVAIARALIMSPKVMLFDEPTSALDPETVGDVLSVMEGLARDGMTMVVVTHEVGFAKNIADRVVLFDHGELVEEAAPSQFFSSSAHERTKKFLEHVM